MRNVFVIGLAALLLVTASAHAQPTPPCVIDTPAQRAVWKRMKTDNHPLYQQLKFNTTWDRYNDGGRWELTAAKADEADGDTSTTLFRKAIDETLKSLPVSTVAGDWIREFGIERAMQYGCLYPHMTEDERTRVRTWLMNEAETILKGTRLGDSDQAGAAYFVLAMADRVLGTTYLSRQVNDAGVLKPVGGLTSTACDLSTLRNAVCYYTKLAKGGQWIEASAGYDLNTMKLLLMGAHWVGISHFPEMAAFLRDFAKWLPHYVTPDLKDAFQSGDNEHPHSLQLNSHLSDLLSFVAGFVDDTDIAARVRQLEADIYAVAGLKLPAPLYARYFYTVDPYAPKLPWREWAGLSFVATGQGHGYWRTAHTADARATWSHCPTFRNGAVDHYGAFAFCDIRHYRNGRFVWDHPMGYAPDSIFANTVLVGARAAGTGIESIDLVGQAFLPGKLAFFAGAQSGHVGTHVTFPGYERAKPFLHERSRYTFELLDGAQSVIATLDRIHADDPRTVSEGTRTYDQMFNYLYQRQAVDAVPKIVELLHHTPVSPTVSADGMSFEWSVGNTTARIEQVLPRTPLDREVIDTKAKHCNNFPLAERKPATCFGGYMPLTEMKFLVKSTRPTHQPWSIYGNCFTARESGDPVSCQPVESVEGDAVAGVRFVRDGRDAVVLVSAKPGPAQAGTYMKTANGTWQTVQDKARIDRVLEARRLTDVRLSIDGDADVYLADLDPAVSIITVNGLPQTVTRTGDLALVSVSADAPAPVPSTTPGELIKQIQDALIKLSELVK